eukprot:366245-Chlamydomonas_euryale.AAC.24
MPACSTLCVLQPHLGLSCEAAQAAANGMSRLQHNNCNTLYTWTAHFRAKQCVANSKGLRLCTHVKRRLPTPHALAHTR